MNDCTKKCQRVKVSVTQSVTVSDDYNRLLNKPSLNGVEISGESTAADLSILSSKANDYIEMKTSDSQEGKYVIVLADGQEPQKLKLSGVKINTVTNIPQELEIGNYVFLLKEKNNGTDNE